MIQSLLFSGLLLTFTVTPNLTLADPLPQEIKGLTSLLNPESAYLSPTSGFMIVNKLAQVRFSNEPTQQVNFPNTFRLLELLFPSKNGRYLIASQVPTDPMSHLSPSLIGKILKELTLVDQKRLSEPEYTATLEKKITAMVLLELSPNGYQKFFKNQRKALDEEIQFINKQVLQCKSPAAKDELLEKIRRLQIHLDQADTALKISLSPPPLEYSNRWSAAHILPFSKALIAALREDSHKLVLIPSTFEVVLGYMWKKAKNQTDLIHYLQELGPHLKSATFPTPIPFTQEEREASAQKLTQASAKELETAFHSDPDLFLYTLNSLKNSVLLTPPELSTGRSHIRKPGESPDLVEIADCVETSLRYIFNFLLYSPKKHIFDASILRRLKTEANLPISQNLIEFYEKHPEVDVSLSQTARDEWATSVIGSLSDPKIEWQAGALTGSFQNVLRVLFDLVFKRPDDSLTKVEKMNKFLQAFSREHYQLDWYPGDHFDKSVFNDIEYGSFTITLNGRDTLLHTSQHAHHHSQPIELHPLQKIVNENFSQPFTKNRPDIHTFERLQNSLQVSSESSTHPLDLAHLIKAAIQNLQKSMTENSEITLSSQPLEWLIKYPKLWIELSQIDSSLPSPENLLKNFGLTSTEKAPFFHQLFYLLSDPKRPNVQHWFYEALSKNFLHLKEHAPFLKKTLMNPNLGISEFLKLKNALFGFLSGLTDQEKELHKSHLEDLFRNADISQKRALLKTLLTYNGSDFSKILNRLIKDDHLEIAKASVYMGLTTNQLSFDTATITQLMQHEDLSLIVFILSGLYTRQNIPFSQLLENLEKTYGPEAFLHGFQAILKSGTHVDCFKTLVLEQPAQSGEFVKETVSLLANPDVESQRLAQRNIRFFLHRIAEIGDSASRQKAREIDQRCFGD